MSRQNNNRFKLTEESAKIVGDTLLTFTSESAVRTRLSTIQAQSLELIRKYYKTMVRAHERVGIRFLHSKRKFYEDEIVRLWRLIRNG